MSSGYKSLHDFYLSSGRHDVNWLPQYMGLIRHMLRIPGHFMPDVDIVLHDYLREYEESPQLAFDVINARMRWGDPSLWLDEFLDWFGQSGQPFVEKAKRYFNMDSVKRSYIRMIVPVRYLTYQSVYRRFRYLRLSRSRAGAYIDPSDRDMLEGSDILDAYSLDSCGRTKLDTVWCPLAPISFKVFHEVLLFHQSCVPWM